MLIIFCLILALVLFLLVGMGVDSGRWNLLAFGLAALTVAALISNRGTLF